MKGTLILKSSVKTYKAEGKSVEELIDKLQVPNPKGLGIFIFEDKGIRERLLNGSLVSRLFGKVSTMQKEIAIKQFKTLFT
jgi:hypothetical protein